MGVWVNTDEKKGRTTQEHAEGKQVAETLEGQK